MVGIRHRLSTIWGEFLNETSLHGCKNIFAKQQGPLQRSLWFLCFGLMVGTLVYTSVDFYLKYLEFSFVTKTSMRYHPELEFPAVTLCNFCQFDKNKFNRSDIDNFYKSEPLLLEFFEKWHHINPFFNASVSKWSGLRINKTDLIRLGFGIKDIMMFGGIAQRELSDQDFFVTYRQPFEKCFTFNWRYSTETYHNKPLMFQATSEMFLVLDSKQDRCLLKMSISGFRLLLHHPDEPLHVRSPSIRLATKHWHKVKVSEKRYQYLGSPYNSYQNQDCLQDDTERKGFDEYRSPYSHASCVIECLTNRTQSLCGCVTEYLFHDNSSVFCTVAERSCAMKIWRSYFLKYPTVICGCKRSCSEIKYDYEVSSLRYKRSNDYMRLAISFKDMMVTTIKHEPELDFGDIISHLGGYMGFCIGASVLTLIELVEVVLKSLKATRLHRYCLVKGREETPSTPGVVIETVSI